MFGRKKITHLYSRCLRKLSSFSRPFNKKQGSVSAVLTISDEVSSALHHGKPVVALETTIVTHGMPHPHNLNTAVEVERLVRAEGAIPATIGILQGKIHIGLNEKQLEYLADKKSKAVKTSRRDFPYVLSQGLNGGTTVSGTMIAAAMAGISVFVTGGIGGVHRGAETSMDVSADLTELGRNPVTVVSAGVKSILDIGLTLEYLETQGVCVATYGSSRKFPAFFTRDSGFTSPYNVQSPQQAASMIYTRELAGLQSGMLIAVPIAPEFDTLGQEIETVIQSVVMEAKEKNIRGKEVTPFILDRVNQITGGKSLEANIGLIRNNAVVGSQIAVELANMQRKDSGDCSSSENEFCKSEPDGAVPAQTIHRAKTATAATGKKVVVVGGTIVDFYAQIKDANFEMNGATYPGSLKQSFGGVGRNLADALTRLGVHTKFISAVGNDSHRAAFEAYCSHMDLSGVARLNGHSTATYCALLRESGELMFGMGDMDTHQLITPEYVFRFKSDLESAAFVCVDGNVSLETIEFVCRFCKTHGVPVLYEPTDLHKASKPFMTSAHEGLTYTSPNLNELKAMATYLTDQCLPNCDSSSAVSMDCDTILHECTKLLDTVANYIPVIIVTLGAHGLLLCRHGDRSQKLPLKSIEVKKGDGLVLEHYPVPPTAGEPVKIVSVSGAGDCLVSAMILGIMQGRDPSVCANMGLKAARLSLQAPQAIPLNLTSDAVLD